MPVPLVLVVDDDDLLRSLMAAALGNAGYRVATGSAGGDVARLTREARPALVVLDMAMETRTAGLDALRGLRADPATAALPVLVCTASHDLLDEQRRGEVRGLGAELLRKPFEVRELLAAVRRLAGRGTCDQLTGGVAG